MILDLAQAPTAEAQIAQQYNLVQLDGEANQLLQARVQRYRIPDGRTVAAVLAQIQGDARILLAQPNYLYRTLSDGRSSPLAKLQYAVASLRIVEAHSLSRGERVRVAVIDTGMDHRHPDLAGSIAASFDAVKDGPSTFGEHGTAVAGIISARLMILGVAPRANLLAVRAFRPEGSAAGLTTSKILLRALDWAAANGARIFNLSFTGPQDEAVRRSIVAVQRRGSILVAAAGNGGARAPVAYPAGYPDVIAVTATDASDRLYDKANQGGYIALAAPGVDILTLAPDGGYRMQSGTSFAAPHVSGVVALMMHLNPGLEAQAVRALLARATLDLGAPGLDAQFGAGRVDAKAAVEAAAASARSKAPR